MRFAIFAVVGLTLLPSPVDNWVLGLSLLARFTPFAVGSMYASDFGFFFALTLLGLVTATSYGVAQLYQPRAAYIQVGAMLGTVMAANVLFVIIPAHRELIRAKEEGRDPDPRPGIVAKQRSVHNNYLTLPVLFTMLAGHFPFTYTHDDAWAVLVALMAVGAAIRVYFNRRHAGETLWWIPVGCACAIAAIAIWLRPP